MASRTSNRHALPRGRAAQQVAYALLTYDTAALRSHVARAELETVTLQATVDALLGDVGRLSAEVAQARHEVGVLREQLAHPGPDPLTDRLLDMLTTQELDLREQVAVTSAAVTDLTGRLTDALSARGEPGPAPTAAEPSSADPGTDHVVHLAPAVTRLDAVPTLDATSHPGAVQAAAERLHEVRRSLDG
jgi:hypothetical protein